jgi:hypothetical protein
MILMVAKTVLKIPMMIMMASPMATTHVQKATLDGLRLQQQILMAMDARIQPVKIPMMTMTA